MSLAITDYIIVIASFFPFRHKLSAVSLSGVVSTDEILPYEMMEIGHEYEDLSKFQQDTVGGSNEYELVGAFSETIENNETSIISEQQTDSLSPPPRQSSRPTQPSQSLKVGGEGIELNECIAYSTTTHGRYTPPYSEQAEPLYAN